METLDFKKHDTNYLERVLTEAKDRLQGTIEETNLLQNRITEIIKYLIALIAAIVVYIIADSNENGSYYHLIIITLLFTIYLTFSSIKVWKVKYRNTNGTSPSDVNHSIDDLNLPSKNNANDYKIYLVSIIMLYDQSIQENLIQNRDLSLNIKTTIDQIMMVYSVILTIFIIIAICRHQNLF